MTHPVADQQRIGVCCTGSALIAAAGAPHSQTPAVISAVLHHRNFLSGVRDVPNGSIDLVIADPPYGLGKDYGNDSDQISGEHYLEFSRNWIDLLLPKLSANGSLYLFLSWQHSPEVFSYVKTRLKMMNEIIWDRRVPSMGGSTRRYSSVHDNIGFFVRARDYYFDLDAVRIPYDPVTKKARSRSLFLGKKWLEVGHNPKDLWSIARLHRQHAERVDHPTQKPLELIERMVLASCPPNGMVLDPFMGSGTSGVAAIRNGRRFTGFEMNGDYIELARRRIDRVHPGGAVVVADDGLSGSRGADNRMTPAMGD